MAAGNSFTSPGLALPASGGSIAHPWALPEERLCPEHAVSLL